MCYYIDIDGNRAADFLFQKREVGVPQLKNRERKAVLYIRNHGVISAGQLAVKARETGHPRIARALFDALVAERDRRKRAIAMLPLDDPKCPHSADQFGVKHRHFVSALSNPALV